MSNIVKVTRKINIHYLNKYVNVIKGDTTVWYLVNNYDSDNIVNMLNTYFDKYKNNVIDYNLLVNFVTKLDLLILKNSEYLMYTLIKAKVIEVYGTKGIKVEYTYRREK
jgi:hypothetical protein